MRAFINAVIRGRSENAFLVEDGTFRMFGETADILSAAGKDTETVDLMGAYVVPGFIDSHMHLLGYGRYLETAQLAGSRSAQEVYERLKERLDEIKPGGWLIGRGYNEEQFTHGGMMDKAGLDAVSTSVPIAVTRSCGHLMVVNSKALELAGMNENTVIEGGTVNTETGVLEENAIIRIQEFWPKETEDSIRSSILRGQKELNRYGITAVGSDDFISLTNDWRLVLDVLLKMAYRQELTVRINEQCEFPSIEEFAAFLDEGYTMDVGDDLFRIGPLKLLTDGSLGARTAALFQPYSDDPSKRGYMSMPMDDIHAWAKLAADYNMATICHAIGDLAVNEVIDVFEDIVLPGNPLHHGLVHCQIMNPQEINRVKALNLNCYFQSLFIDDDAPILERRVGKQRAASSYPFRSLYESVTASNGSDAPVEQPDVMKGIRLAMTRESISCQGYAMNKDESLTLDQAIDSYTISGAKAFFADDRIGALREGYYADFAVLETSPETCPAEKVSDIRIMMTVMNGETVYER